eukprot:gene14821-biopygen18663
MGLVGPVRPVAPVRPSKGTAPWEKRQRTRTGRGSHDKNQRNGRGPDAGVV